MRHVPFDPPNGLSGEQLEWWSNWLRRAENCQKILLDNYNNGKEVEFDSSVWRDLKDWLLVNVFDKKCAYCESAIRAIYPGDGEHYRPKGNVTVKVDGAKKRVLDSAGLSHPGYFWLAYNWRNLLPACFACNNAKSDQFPVSKTHVCKLAPGPVDLNLEEEPLLICPYLEEPDEFLVFGEGGVVAARNGDPRGLATIEVFDLNREDLRDERQKRQEAVKATLAMAIVRALSEDKPIDDIGEYLDGWIDAAAPYSKAVRSYAELRLAALPRTL
ncbi:hypothetical protein WBP07_11430 [Novosphingobium sp. BL-8A]|uniref:hypothetical protein n=1 Tax=Novosphingobium sp. BL-8A TaxID=3127639 RepID=UPI0037576373